MSNFSTFSPVGSVVKYQEFTSSGTFTPSAALVAQGGYVNIILVGGGGGGGSDAKTSYGGGGGGGQVVMRTGKITSAQSITIGAAGTGGGATGGTGGTSTVATVCTAQGGRGGQGGNSSGGAGGGSGLNVPTTYDGTNSILANSGTNIGKD